jgi:putative Mg2+ transporter-C (MgtC) family protein
MGVGAGHQYASLIGCITLIGILYTFTKIEIWIDRINRVHVYKITCPYREHVFEHFEALMKQHKLNFKRGAQCRHHQTVTATWESEGPKKGHDAFIHLILNDITVEKFEF